MSNESILREALEEAASALMSEGDPEGAKRAYASLAATEAPEQPLTDAMLKDYEFAIAIISRSYPDRSEAMSLRLRDYLAAPVQQERDIWISVEDRMPESDSDVLVRCSDGTIQSSIVHSVFGFTGLHFGSVVTHWMPLPPPPAIAATPKGSTK